MKKKEFVSVIESLPKSVRFNPHSYRCLICNEPMGFYRYGREYLLKCQNRHYYSLDHYLREYLVLVVNWYELEVLESF